MHTIHAGPFVVGPTRIEIHFSLQMCAELTGSTACRLTTSATFKLCARFATQHVWIGSDVLLHSTVMTLIARLHCTIIPPAP